MIERLEINNFKLHKNTVLDFKNLTVLCGGNSVGKSSAIQALLLLRESHINKSNFEYLDLLSNPVKIGTIEDALYHYSANDIISFTLKGVKDYSFKFGFNENDFTKTLIEASIPNTNTKSSEIENESLFNENFQYISSARLGPQTSYPKDDVVVDKYKQISVNEGKAEYCIHFLSKNQNNIVINDLLNHNTTLNNLIGQVTAWEKEISEGVIVLIKDNGKLGFELKYQYETNLGTKRTNEHTAQNVGFGLTYVLPILVAVLSSRPGALIIIENPEAHLHPKGISKLTELLCLAAEAGIQIIIETHSDHIINGILVNTKRYEKDRIGINREKISIYQFEKDNNEHCVVVKDVNILEGGIFENQPNGFFDQIEKDLENLMGF